MKKTLIVIYTFILIGFLITPIAPRALEVSHKEVFKNSIYLLDDEDGTWVDDIRDKTKELVEEGEKKKQEQEEAFKHCDTLLGDPTDENSVAWLLQQILDFIKVIGPILVVVLSSIDFLTVILKGDDEAMGKAQKKLVTRLLLAASLFFLPLIVEVLLDVFGFVSDSTCGLS